MRVPAFMYLEIVISKFMHQCLWCQTPTKRLPTRNYFLASNLQCHGLGWSAREEVGYFRDRMGSGSLNLLIPVYVCVSGLLPSAGAVGGVSGFTSWGLLHILLRLPTSTTCLRHWPVGKKTSKNDHSITPASANTKLTVMTTTKLAYRSQEQLSF